MKTILIDTNVLLRYLVADIPDQFKKAKKTIKNIEDEKLKAKISLLVVNELIWILENYYNLKRYIYIPPVLKVLALKNIKIIETKKSLVVKTLKRMLKENLDFTDLYLLEIKNDKKLLTFDRKLSKLASDL